MKDYNHSEDDLTIKNVELAAGNGGFGKKHYAPCYSTDIKEEINYKEKINGIDFYCNAEKTPFPDNRWEKIIINNPYGFGFRKEEEAQKLLKELVRIAINGGQVIMTGNETKNPYFKLKKIEKQIAIFNAENKDNSLSLQMKEESIDAAIEYPDDEFYASDGIFKAFPNKRITISISK